MMKEQTSSASKQLLELNGREEYVNSAEFETMTRFKYENRASGLGSYYTAEGEFKAIYDGTAGSWRATI
jgi:hypothetical protein